MKLQEKKIRAGIYLLFSIYMLIYACFSLYDVFWVLILTGFICLVGGIAVMPLKRQANAQQANTPELKRIRSALLAGHGILALALLRLLATPFMQ